MSSPGRRLNEALCLALQRVVDLDPTAGRALRRLEGRSLGVELLGPGLKLVIAVNDHRIEAIAPDDQVSAWVQATPGVLLGLAARGGRPASGQLTMSGDAESAQRYQAFFRGLKPDWEEGLTRIFGDIIGVQIQRVLSGGLQWVRRTGSSLEQDLGEFLVEESRILVSRAELDEFLDAVDDLRDDVSRLEAGISRIKESRDTP